MNDSPLINEMLPDKVDYITKEVKVSEFIDGLKTGSLITLWNIYQMLLSTNK